MKLNYKVAPPIIDVEIITELYNKNDKTNNMVTSNINVDIIEDDELKNSSKEFFIGDIVLITNKDTGNPTYIGIISFIGKFTDSSLNSINNQFTLDKYSKYPCVQITIIYDLEDNKSSGNRLCEPAIMQPSSSGIYTSPIHSSILMDPTRHYMTKVNVDILVYK